MSDFTDAEIEMFRYLENLRQSGITNMFGAGPYLAGAFGISSREASTILMKWMKNYEQLLADGIISRGDE